MATITKAHKGMRLRHRESGKVFTVDSVFRNPSNGFAGKPLEPFASVVTDQGREFVNLSNLEDDEFFEPIA